VKSFSTKTKQCRYQRQESIHDLPQVQNFRLQQLLVAEKGEAAFASYQSLQVLSSYMAYIPSNRSLRFHLLPPSLNTCLHSCLYHKLTLFIKNTYNFIFLNKFIKKHYTTTLNQRLTWSCCRGCTAIDGPSLNLTATDPSRR